MDINIKPKPETTIKLPKTVIRDIAALVEDQKKIQKVISDMKNKINEIHSFDERIPDEPPSSAGTSGNSTNARASGSGDGTSGSGAGSATPYSNPGYRGPTRIYGTS